MGISTSAVCVVSLVAGGTPLSAMVAVSKTATAIRFDGAGVTNPLTPATHAAIATIENDNFMVLGTLKQGYVTRRFECKEGVMSVRTDVLICKERRMRMCKSV